MSAPKTCPECGAPVAGRNGSTVKYNCGTQAVSLHAGGYDLHLRCNLIEIDPKIHIYICKCKKRRYVVQRVKGQIPHTIACKCDRQAKLAETHDASEFYKPEPDVAEQISLANVDTAEWLEAGGLILR